MDNVVKIKDHPKYRGFSHPPHTVQKGKMTLVHECGSTSFNILLGSDDTAVMYCAKCNQPLETTFKMVGGGDENPSTGPQAA